MVPCKTCQKNIDDGKSASICCDVCDSWIHKAKVCSGLRKDMYALITKKDPYVCPKCIASAKSAFKGGASQKAEKELEQLRLVNEDLIVRNEQLLNELSAKESKIILLEDQLRTGMERKERESWSKPSRPRCVGAGSRPRLSMTDYPPLRTSNRFEALETEGEAFQIETHGGVNYNKVAPCSSTAVEKCVEVAGLYGPPKKSQPMAKRKYRTKRYVFVVTDSQGRKCGRLVNERVKDGECTAEVWVHPGAASDSLVEVAQNGMEATRENDCMVVVGGVNGVNECSVQQLGNKLDKLATKSKGKHVAFVETPYRFDVVGNNHLIKVQNKVIFEYCEKFNWTYLPLNNSLSWECYTKHGLHLNSKGKEILSSIIAGHIHSLEHSKVDVPTDSNNKVSKNDVDKSPHRIR